MREIKHLSVHQWLRSAIPDSQQPNSPIGFLFLKLPPPPCAVLLVKMRLSCSGKSWKLQLFQQLSRMEHPKAQEKLENGKKKTVERMETATFSAVWQKPPKAKENLENCRGNKPCAICLYVVTCTNSAGNLGNRRKKLGLVPLAG